MESTSRSRSSRQCTRNPVPAHLILHLEYTKQAAGDFPSPERCNAQFMPSVPGREKARDQRLE